MPYLGRNPAISNTVTGDLAVSGSILADGQISAGRINHKLALNGSDAASPQANENDQFLIEDGGSDGSGTNAGDNLLLENATGGQAISGDVIGAGIPVSSIAGAGTSGQFLQSQGTNLPPTFGDVSSGLTKISSQDATGAAVEFTSSHFANSTYSGYQFHLHNIATSSDSDRLYVNTSTDGGSTYESTYAWVVSEWNTNTGVNLTKDSNEGSTHLQLGLDSNVGSATNETFSGIFNLFNPGATQYTQMTWHCCYDDDQAGVYFTHTLGCGKRPSAADVDGIKFFFGNDFAGSGKITMYGLQA